MENIAFELFLSKSRRMRIDLEIFFVLKIFSLVNLGKDFEQYLPTLT
jgi:hypothetical protein